MSVARSTVAMSRVTTNGFTPALIAGCARRV
jgi:hypothetical protein